MRLTLRTLARCGLALAIVACADGATELAYDGADVQLLTPEVAAQLDARGRFPEQQVEPGYLNPRTRTDADSLARRFIAAAASLRREEWESHRGAAIDVARLRRCGPIRYASSAYEVTLFAASQPWRPNAGGHYQMVFCGADARPTLRVQVPVEPALSAANFSGALANIQAEGVAIEREAYALIGPEEAVRLVAGRTGRRVAAVPELVNERYLFGMPRWIVQLESPVIVRGSESLEVDTISFVAVGQYFTETGGSFIPTVLRPRALPTLTARLDSLRVMEEDPIDVYTVRWGIPKRVEPFVRLIP